ncbi:GNAT family N-acetyltransferase [Paludibacterium purpuratum]|uniref:Acetyltransferase (GNAT) family protein n=1 Tax=Paludibacterium purpuratum TaxID=1144873 RepID=A0A4V3DW01_9NEIS|nr:GNAT family N-acetyltransferase [Paludibacterium purpuratum]TDR82909.1 acetyltransferase (GNAT) family protein [Paludibacterium purpuratum]
MATHSTTADGAIVIRQAVYDDARALAALGMLVFLHTYAVDGIDDELAAHVQHNLTPEQFEDWLADPRQRILVAVRGERLLGFARLALDQPCPADRLADSELETLYVHPLFVGRGIGRALLAASRAHAGQLWLTVWTHNRRARAFYAAQGMREVGKTHFLLGETPHLNHVLSDSPA